VWDCNPVTRKQAKEKLKKLKELKITNQYLSEITGKKYKAGGRFDF
jgi:hypothetical protein